MQLFEFIGNHIFLFLAFFVVLGALIWSFIGDKIQGITAIAPLAAVNLLNQEDAIVLDVREEGEFKQGHILNALHIPLSQLSDKIGTLEKYRDRPIIASCASGQRSGQACSRLSKQGFEKMYNLKGGISAWASANLPLEK